MSSFIPLDRVVDLLKNIIDGIRCPICDKSTGDRNRYACGHTGCDGCLTSAEGCMLCLTPPTTSTLNKIADKPLSDRVKNANRLLDACQETFNIDVYKRNRISDKLKLEKELFPECIQAPATYCNKRKSLISSSNKENRFQFTLPGEQISPRKQFNMKKHSNAIQHWLNENDSYSRRVFSELNVNQQSYTNTRKKLSPSILNSRKRNHSISPIRQIEKKSNENKKKKKSLKEKETYWENKTQKKCEHEESGIVLDDEPIYIEDSQNQTVDKDKLALLAVERADNEVFDLLSLQSLKQAQDLKSQNDNVCLDKTVHDKSVKVPFYMKASLIQKCEECGVVEDFINNTSSNIDSTNMSISIENSNFITTINISNCDENQQYKSSISIQTNISDLNDSFDTHYATKEKEDDLNQRNAQIENNKHHNTVQTVYRNSEDIDIFEDDCEIEHIPLINAPESKEIYKKSVVIDDSDSDTISEEPSFLQVSADVHVSCEQQDYGILGEICSDQVACKSKCKVRGATPDSSNSSDKENCDPNKMKKRKGNKKTKSTKK